MPNDKLTQLAEAFRDDIATELDIDPDKLPNKIGRAVVDILKGWDAYEWEEAATMLPELAAWGDLRFADGQEEATDRVHGERDDALRRYNDEREAVGRNRIDYDGEYSGDMPLPPTRAGAIVAWAERLGMDVREVSTHPEDRTVVWLLVGDDS